MQVRRVVGFIFVAVAGCQQLPVDRTGAPLVLFPPGATPQQTNFKIGVGGQAEPGLEFWSDVDGSIAGVRFYKSSGDTGTHVGRVWTVDGSQVLATALFTNETATGWQEAHFIPQVPLYAGQHMVVSYHSPTGTVSLTDGYYGAQVDSPPLHVPAGGGRYGGGTTTVPGFPTQNYDNSSFWVDVDFQPQASGTNSTLFDPSLTATNEAASFAPIELGVTFHSDVDGALHGVRFYKTPHDLGAHVAHLWDANGNLVATAGSQVETATGWQEIPLAANVKAGQTYVASYSTSSPYPVAQHAFDAPVDRAPLHAPVAAGVYAASGFPSQTNTNSSYFVDVDFEAGACAATCSACGADDGCGHTCCAFGEYSLWNRSVAQLPPATTSSGSLEVGTRFTVASAGLARALRYYKDPSGAPSTTGHLWDASGNLLATVTFAAGTSSGWQEALLAPSVPLQAGQTYVASYTTNGGYAYSPDYFDSYGHGAPPISAPQNAGVSGAAGSFPTQQTGTNYWTDVDFEPNPAAATLFASWSTANSLLRASSRLELGARITLTNAPGAQAGSITRLRFYKVFGGASTHVAHLWDGNNHLVGTATFSTETTSGWQEAPLDTPLFVVPGQTFSVTYTVPYNTWYGTTAGMFGSTSSSGPFSWRNGAGLYGPGSIGTPSYPTTSSSTNYWVDFVFQPVGGCVPHCIGTANDPNAPKTCGDSDGCGGICCSGSGCAPVQYCEAPCRSVGPGCGDLCQWQNGFGCPPVQPFFSAALGVNIPSLYQYYFTDKPLGSDNGRQQLQMAAANGFKIVRFFAASEWPSQMRDPNYGWLGNRDGFFARFDALVADAREAGVTLVPNFLNNLYVWGDLAEPPLGRSQLFTVSPAKSPSRLMMEEYIKSIVARYKNDPTISFWEIGSELNLEADDTATWSCDGFSGDECYSACVNGAQCHRDAAHDNYYSCNDCRGISSPQEDLGAFFGDIAALIKATDPTRLVSSGASSLRPNAWHIARRNLFPDPPGVPGGGLYNQFDTPGEFDEMLGRLNPAGVDLISAHVYLGTDPSRWGDTDVSGANFITHMQSFAQAHGQQLYIGEYGQFEVGTHGCGGLAGKICGGVDASKAATERIIDTLVADNVRYGTLFGWMAQPLDPLCVADTSCTMQNNNPIVPYLTNRAQAWGTCVGQANGTPCPGGVCTSAVCVPPITPAAATTTIADWEYSADCAFVTGQTGWSNTNGPQGTLQMVHPSGNPRVCLDLQAASNSTVAPNGGNPPYVTQSPLIHLTNPPGPQGGVITVRFNGRSSVADSQVGIHQSPVDNFALVAVKQGTSAADNEIGGVTAILLPGTTDVSVEVRLNEPNATADLTSIQVIQQGPVDQPPSP